MLAIAKIFVSYMPTANTTAVCQVVNSLNPSIPLTSCLLWPPTVAAQQAALIMTGITTQVEALNLLQVIATFGTGVPSKDFPPIQACIDKINLDTLEYTALWNDTGASPFCKVKLSDGSINYAPISRVQDLLSTPRGTAAVSVIVNSYRDAISQIDVSSMKMACSTGIAYADLVPGLLQELCGCYIDVQNVQQFTTDEKALLLQRPECTPSCLSAAVRYARGGIPVTCQQDLCIADQINVTGDSVSIAQVCPQQCPKLYQCVCYIHVNGQVLNNQNCNTAYIVNDKGQIVGAVHNQAESIAQGWRKGLRSLIERPVALIAFLVIAAVIAVVVLVILIVQHMRHRTPVRKY